MFSCKTLKTFYDQFILGFFSIMKVKPPTNTSTSNQNTTDTISEYCYGNEVMIEPSGEENGTKAVSQTVGQQYVSIYWHRRLMLWHHTHNVLYFSTPVNPLCCWIVYFYFSFIRSWNCWRNFQLRMMKNLSMFFWKRDTCGGKSISARLNPRGHVPFCI